MATVDPEPLDIVVIWGSVIKVLVMQARLEFGFPRTYIKVGQA